MTQFPLPLPTIETGKPNISSIPWSLSSNQETQFGSRYKKKNLLQEKVDISIPHPTSTAFFFQRYWKEILVSWSTTGMWLILSTFFHLHTSLCLEHGHVMTGSTAAILLLWDKTVWQGIAESKNRRGVFDFSESLLSSGLFTFSLFVVWVKVKPYIFVLLYLVFCL